MKLQDYEAKEAALKPLMMKLALQELIDCKEDLPVQIKALMDIMKTSRLNLKRVFAEEHDPNSITEGEVMASLLQLAFETLTAHVHTLPLEIRRKIEAVLEVKKGIEQLSPVQKKKPGRPVGSRNAPKKTRPSKAEIKPDDVEFFRGCLTETYMQFNDKFNFKRVESARGFPDQIKHELLFRAFVKLAQERGVEPEILMDNQSLRLAAAEALSKVLTIRPRQAKSFYAYTSPSFRGRKGSAWEKFSTTQEGWGQ